MQEGSIAGDSRLGQRNDGVVSNKPQPVRKGGPTGPLRKNNTIEEEKVQKKGVATRMKTMQPGGKMSFGKGP